MKVIGKIEPEYKGEEGQITNGEYVGGAIVLLKPQEAKAIASLQNVWKGNVFKFDTGYYGIQEEDIEEAFRAIMSFVEAKLAVNEFREVVNRLDDMLIKGGEDEL